MSIGKAQALALADGFIDSISVDGREGLQPRETISELLLIASEFVEDMQNNLNDSNSNASGELSKSIKAQNPPIVVPGKLTVNIEMLDYGLFVNAGVKGTRSGTSTAGYAFKNDRPASIKQDPHGMTAMILKWIQRGKQSTSNTNAKKTISANEKKNSSIGDITNAWLAARSIKRRGLKPTAFIDKAVKVSEDKVEDRLGTAFAIDINNALTK